MGSVEILIVEDSPTQAWQLKQILEQQGYHASVTRNGEEGLAFLRKKKPTLVISDILMPKMDGYQLCQMMKADDTLKDIPVILLTVLSDPLDVIRGLQCRADNFLTKPYEGQFLISRIQSILVNQELRKNSSGRTGLEVFYAGQKHCIASERQQIIDLLLSTFENAIQKNLELEKARLELEKANAALSTLALCDELTHLYNRRGFFTLAEQHLKLAHRTQKGSLLFFIDLDGLKQINDTVGHQEGNLALIRIAEVLRETFRESDIVARWGGDEFTVLALNSPTDCAHVLTERLQRNLAASNAQANRLYQLSCSVGVTPLDPASSVSLEDVMARADKALYEHKRSKRKP